MDQQTNASQREETLSQHYDEVRPHRETSALPSSPLVWTNMQYILGSLPPAQPVAESVKPQERWGHASVCAYDKKMFIIGGYQGKNNNQTSQANVGVVARQGLQQRALQLQPGLAQTNNPTTTTTTTLNLGSLAFQQATVSSVQREQQQVVEVRSRERAVFADFQSASDSPISPSDTGHMSSDTSSDIFTVTFAGAHNSARAQLVGDGVDQEGSNDGHQGANSGTETHSSRADEEQMEGCIDGLSTPENTTTHTGEAKVVQADECEDSESLDNEQIQVSLDDLNQAMQVTDPQQNSPEVPAPIFIQNFQEAPVARVSSPLTPVNQVESSDSHVTLMNPFILSNEENPNIQALPSSSNELSSEPLTHPNSFSSFNSSSISSPMQMHLNRIQLASTLQQQSSLPLAPPQFPLIAPLQQHTQSSHIGQYLGDIWEFDFATCAFIKHKPLGEDASLLERSNHTAIFYEPHNAIYVFGGGQAQRLRFNDTLRLSLPTDSSAETKVNRIMLQEGSPMPCARTYHASCLVSNFMVVSAGEANNTDLNDMWALDLEKSCWFKLELMNSQFMSKRFHTVSTLSKNRVVSFGGCHSEYIHLNDVNVFELDNFVKSGGADAQVMCQKLDFSQCPQSNSVPSTRWGHAAAVYQDRLYILGGRNNDDINDLHCLDIDLCQWSQVEIGHPMPKPRRRHSAVFVSSSLVMFGGFDGEFFNDLHLLHFDQHVKDFGSLHTSPQTLYEDYAKLVDTKEHSNIRFQLDPVTPGGPDQFVYANKSLVLFRLFEREVREYSQESRVFQLRMEEVLSCPQTKSMCPQFFQRVFDAKTGQTLRLPGINQRSEFILFLEFCYCDRLVQSVTGTQIATLKHICQVLGLSTVTTYFQSLAMHIHNKLQGELVKDFEAKVMQQLGGSASAANSGNIENPVSNLTEEQLCELEKSVNELLHTVRFKFDQLDSPQVIQSPEDRIEKQNTIIHAEMVKCRNLDHFFDVIFELDGKHLMRANSAVLYARCEYFRIMFEAKYGFQECSRKDLTLQNEVRHCGVHQVVVRGIPKQYFTAIIQFLYTDNFCQTECTLAFFLRLLLYADYFMIGRLSELCQKILRQFVTPKNVMDLYLVAHAHNAESLERYCINFMTINQAEIQKSHQWKDFQRKCKLYDRTCQLQKVKNELEQELKKNFVSISLQRHIQKMTRPNWIAYELGAAELMPSRTQGQQQTLTDSKESISRDEDSYATPSKTPTAGNRPGFTMIQSRPQVSTTTAKPKKGGATAPSNRRDNSKLQEPTIVRVATNATSRIVQPSSNELENGLASDLDLDSIMAVPSYIYFEEHFPIGFYNMGSKPTQANKSKKLLGQYPFGMTVEQEEVKDEGFSIFGPRKAKPMVGNFVNPRQMQPINDPDESENRDPNQNRMMITTTGANKGWTQVSKQRKPAFVAQSAQIGQGKGDGGLTPVIDDRRSVETSQQNSTSKLFNSVGQQLSKYWRY